MSVSTAWKESWTGSRFPPDFFLKVNSVDRPSWPSMLLCTGPAHKISAAQYPSHPMPWSPSPPRPPPSPGQKCWKNPPWWKCYLSLVGSQVVLTHLLPLDLLILWNKGTVWCSAMHPIGCSLELWSPNLVPQKAHSCSRIIVVRNSLVKILSSPSWGAAPGTWFHPLWSPEQWYQLWKTNLKMCIMIHEHFDAKTLREMPSPVWISRSAAEMKTSWMILIALGYRFQIFLKWISLKPPSPYWWGSCLHPPCSSSQPGVLCEW